jgi:twitching motility protein PilT
MIDKLNNERHQHILTIEDPIEYIHPHRNCIVNQREVHGDTHGFAKALRAALREDPDIVLVGELRDLETIEAGLRIAETGHLTLSTLHANSAANTINRIIDVFPAHQQNQIRAQLSLVLEGIICQALIPRADGQGRVPALEILLPTPGIRNLIRDDKVHQIYSAMQAGQEKLAMQTMNQSLASLCLQKLITPDEAIAASSYKDELQEMLRRGVGTLPNTGHRAAAKPSGVVEPLRR